MLKRLNTSSFIVLWHFTIAVSAQGEPRELASAHLADSTVIQRIAFGSCFAPQLEPDIWSTIDEFDPDVFLYLGDNVYQSEETDDMALPHLREAYQLLAEVRSFETFRACTPIFPIWDDHDFGMNDAGASWRPKYESEKLFEQVWAVAEDDPRRARDGIYFSRTVGPPGLRVQIIMLDTRFFRSDINRMKTVTGGKRYVPAIIHNGGFINKENEISGVTYGGSEFADYDNDGDFDLVVTGLDLSNGYLTRLYNNEAGELIETSDEFLGLLRSRVAWADVDNDGDMDFVVGGQYGGIADTRARMYRNDGPGFSELSLSDSVLAQVALPSFDWGDYDNDGDVDLLLTGQIGIQAARITSILRNDGNFVFTPLNHELVPVRTGDAKWADYDNDGDLDVAICGTDTAEAFGNYITRIYENTLNTANLAPAVPMNLQSTVSETDVLLEWDAVVDDLTPQNTITYNLRIGTERSKSDVMNAMSIEEDGFRKLMSIGNTNFNTHWEVRGLADGTYFWSVQAIDGSIMGSPFSDEAMFTVGAVTDISTDKDILRFSALPVCRVSVESLSTATGS